MGIFYLNSYPTVILSGLYGIAIFLTLMVFSSRKPTKSSLFLFGLVASGIFSLFLIDEHDNCNCSFLYKHNFITFFSSLSSIYTSISDLEIEHDTNPFDFTYFDLFKNDFFDFISISPIFDVDFDYNFDTGSVCKSLQSDGVVKKGMLVLHIGGPKLRGVENSTSVVPKTASPLSNLFRPRPSNFTTPTFSL